MCFAAVIALSALDAATLAVHVPTLLPVLTDEGMGIAVIEVLRRLSGEFLAPYAPPLVQLLEEASDADVRRYAVEVFSFLDEASFLQHYERLLLPLLTHGDEDVRLYAVSPLRRLPAGLLAEHVHALLPLLGDEYVSEGAWDVFGQLDAAVLA